MEQADVDEVQLEYEVSAPAIHLCAIRRSELPLPGVMASWTAKSRRYFVRYPSSSAASLSRRQTAVAKQVSVADENMLERLQSLVDKSLLQVANAATVDEQCPRFRMLETIREFGLEQLSACGEFELVQEQHARFFRALVGEEDGWLPHNALRIWLDQLESDHDNLRAGLHWSQTAAEGAEIGPRLACALYLFWYVRGYFSEGREWYERFLTTVPVSQPFCRLRANLLWAAAFLAWRQGDYQAAGSLSDQSVALCANLEPDRNTLMAVAVHGLVASHQARYSIAHASLERGLEAARLAQDAYILALLLAVSGVLAYLEGNCRSSARTATRAWRWAVTAQQEP